MPGPFLVFCEQRDGRLQSAGVEALGQASRLALAAGESVVAVLIGSGLRAPAAELGARGADRVLVADDPSLARYGAEAYASILAPAAAGLRPRAILMGATAMGKDLGPKLAARLGSALIQDCIAVDVEPDGSIIATRPVYGGKLRERVQAVTQELQVLTLRPHVFDAPPPRPRSQAPVEELPVPRSADRPAASVLEVLERSAGRADLADAPIVVSGGRGLKGPENFRLLEELADVLGAAVGASRAVVDAGWIDHSHQVGLTGRTIAPQLYIACGISGAMQHQAGISSARVVVAINSNPGAPIFNIATYGIVGDLFEIVPLLAEELRRHRAHVNP